MSVNITHNNNGHHYRIAIDIAKEGSEIFDLTPYFKGRVGDNRFGLEIVWYYQGQLLDCTGMKPIIQGNVGNFSLDEKKNVQMAPDASVVAYTGDPKDCQSNGKAIYHFPEQMFPKEGVFSGFIGLIDDSDEGGKAHYSGVNIWFRVLGGIAQMGKAAAFYISDLETAIQNGKEKLREALTDYEAQFKAIMDSLNKMGDDAKKDFTDWLAKFKQSLTDAMAEINDPKDGLYVRYNQLLDMTKQIQETLKQAQFHDRPFQLKTVADMKAYAPLIAGDIAITQGWDNYDDGHGAYWNIRVKHKDEVPDENNVISLDNGMVAERNSSLLSADSLEDFLFGYTIEIKHNQCEHPLHPAVLYYEDAIGTERDGLGKTSHGFGQTNTKLINCIAEYPDVNTIKVKIPRNFYLDAVPHYKFGAWYLIDGNRTIKVDLGMPINDAKAQAGDGEGESYLSPNTGYFSKPTSPTDLRAVYIDEHTQRLLWRGV
ncbi:DUF2479 domain-containing protein [Limosilactobacillus reuteri]|nr:DUF2479 domain-containing protein [Limosilactobacillus reuteri]